MTPLLAEPERRVGETTPRVEEVAWPDSVAELFRAFASLPGAIFFDSARHDPRLGRYSFLSADPFETLHSRGERVVLTELNGPREVWDDGDPLELLARRLKLYRAVPAVEPVPFQGGAAGLFSYDLCHHFERLPRPRSDEFRIPDLVVGLYDWTVALDHELRRAWVISTGFPAASPSARRRRADERLAEVCERLARTGTADRGCESRLTAGQRPLPCPAAIRLPATSLVPQHAVDAMGRGLTSNFSRDQYLRAVERAIEYVFAGDVYQVNFAQRLLAPLTEPPTELYLRLRERNPAPFAGYFDAGEFQIASASPERFLYVQDGAVETRPIKGTRPRFPTPEADMLSGLELLASAKDRSENVMIVDLLRNDLGRVCEFGSVRVADPLRLESFEFVHHLVSEVRGRLRSECGPIDLLRAAFPGGSVTGAPKIRAMEIIAELEPTARGPYCGSLGYIGFDGSMDTNILIRTFTASRGWIQFPVGGGIVAESSPGREYEETLHKAEGMIRALKLNGRTV
jgi:para-aminobenzoate synthetase component 1